jgi:hypothetical protein
MHLLGDEAAQFDPSITLPNANPNPVPLMKQPKTQLLSAGENNNYSFLTHLIYNVQ